MSESDILKIFKALSVKSRMRIVKLIRDRQMCVNAITRHLDISQPAVSQHLAVLKEAGLVSGERYGSIIHYTLNVERFDDFRHSINSLLDDK